MIRLRAFLPICLLTAAIIIFLPELLAGGEHERDLSVEITSAKLSKRSGLSVSWSVANASNHAVQIYTTFLNGPVPSSEVSADGTLLIFSSIQGKLKGKPYSYPESKFKVLEPGGVIKGVLNDRGYYHNWSLTGKPKRIRLFVSYGPVTDLTTLLTQANDSETEHPANPIVEWQHVQGSEPATLR